MTVYFIGAGIGGIEYLTVQAHNLIRQGQVILYDDLVDASLLELAPVDCLKISVGKRGGKTSTSQEKINQLLRKYSQEYERVIRLKSGDIGIFGRIHEELSCLQSIDVEYQLIPGLSSALAVPLLAHIMLTEKNDSRCLSILTGHDPESLDWFALSKIDTLVILMGGINLPIIIQKLQEHGRSSNLPIAIIKNGGRTDQQIWKGTIGNILQKTANRSLSPCIIVIGKVVEYSY
jgi:uroporphyrin-III C-methyltransferase